MLHLGVVRPVEGWFGGNSCSLLFYWYLLCRSWNPEVKISDADAMRRQAVQWAEDFSQLALTSGNLYLISGLMQTRWQGEYSSG